MIPDLVVREIGAKSKHALARVLNPIEGNRMNTTCPKCQKGNMALPLALAPLTPGSPAKGGAKLICPECGYSVEPGEMDPRRNKAK